VKTLLFLVLNIALCMAGVLLMSNNADRFWNYFITGGCLMIQMVLIGGLSNRLDKNLKVLQPDARTGTLVPDAQRQLRPYDALYWGVFAFLLGFVVLGILVSNIEPFSPIFVLVMLTNFYLLMSTLTGAFYRYTINGGKVWYRWAFWGGLILAVAVVFKLGAPIHDVKTIGQTMPPEKRVDFDRWFQQWIEAKDSSQAEIPIYLVAAQGGGSRAGFWASEILNRLEVAGNYQFHRHCLSITSASGGSAGTGATLGAWKFARDSAQALPALVRRLEDEEMPENAAQSSLLDSLHLGFAQGMFQRNYLSSSFFDLFVTEPGVSFISFSKWRFDRNYSHQRNEALGVAAGIRHGLGLPKSSQSIRIGQRIRSLFQNGARSSLHIGPKTRIPNYAFEPYLNYWYDEQQRPVTEWPLYFPITTNVHTGQCGYASPVKVQPALFTDAVDIIGEVGRSAPGRTLTMVGATNLSQLFPVMNAFTFIPGSGNYLDGGVFENMGLPLTLAIAHRVDSLVKNAPYTAAYRKKVRIHVLVLVNSAHTYSSPTRPLPPVKRKWQPTMIVGFMGAESMDGRTRHFMEQARQTLPASATLETFVLQYPHPETNKTEKVPLGRWLSRRSVQTMKNRAQALQPKIEKTVAPLRKKG
jgi:hypothetical protein